MRLSEKVCFGLAVVAMAGCGIGVNMHANHATTAESDADSVSLVGNSITLYDATGILLSAAGSAGSAYTAKEAARKQAIKDGAKAGDKYSYEAKVIPPAPGVWTSFTYAWGDGETDDGRAVEYRQFDMRTSLGKWNMFGFRTSFLMAAVWSQYSDLASEGGDIANKETAVYIGMPLGLKFARRVGAKGTFTWHLAIDPVVGGLAAAVGDAWQMAEAGAHFDFRIIKNINLFVDGNARRAAGIGEKYQWNEYVATAGLTFIFWEDKLKFMGK